MLKKILIGLGIVLIALGVLIATRPETFHVERTTTVKAPPEKVFALIQDFHNWANWSPWEKLDPQMKKVFSGAASGVGASYAWEGKNDVGKGNMIITATSAPGSVKLKLEFLEPFKASNDVAFTIAAKDGGTQVTWAMDGRNNFFSKAFSLVADMDKLVGKDFEEGLANLKALAEK